MHVDECAQMKFYRHLVVEFWRDHPGAKAKLAGAGDLDALGSARRSRPRDGRSAGGFVDKLRTWAQPVYSIPLFLLALGGLVLPAPAA